MVEKVGPTRRSVRVGFGGTYEVVTSGDGHFVDKAII